MSTKAIVQTWCLGFIAALVLVPFSVHRLDEPVAVWCLHRFHGLEHVGNHLASPLLVGGESLVALALGIYRIATGRLASLAKIVVIGCVTSLSAFALNEGVLKVIFGMAPPYIVIGQGAPHVLHLFQGTWQSSFPSGHMVLATGFVMTFVGQDRRLLVLLLAGVLLAAGLLIAGGWHFVSDVIAGALVGSTAGLTSATLWRRHMALSR